MIGSILWGALTGAAIGLYVDPKGAKRGAMAGAALVPIIGFIRGGFARRGSRALGVPTNCRREIARKKKE